jgi:hypothetical protein
MNLGFSIYSQGLRRGACGICGISGPSRTASGVLLPYHAASRPVLDLQEATGSYLVTSPVVIPGLGALLTQILLLAVFHYHDLTVQVHTSMVQRDDKARFIHWVAR